MNLQIETKFAPEVKNAPQTTKPEEEEKLSAEEQRSREEIENLKHFRNLRVNYANSATDLAISSFAMWWVFILLIYNHEKHSDAFFATLTTGCTINIVAAFLAITKGLFPNKKD